MAQYIIDNKQSSILADVVESYLEDTSKLSIISSYFTVYAYQQLKDKLSKIDEVRLLLNDDYLETNSTIFFGSDSERRFKNRFDLKRVSKECTLWIEEKVKIRTTSQKNVIGTKLFHVQNSQKEDISITMPSSNFDSEGLGYVPSKVYAFNNFTDEESATAQMLEFFNRLWDDASLVEDVKTDILKNLQRGYKDYTPQEVYFFTLYNLFKEYLEDLDEEKIVKNKTGFKDTKIWNMLYKFQQDGTLGAIQKIEKYGGCIIADSVGLGKTFEALAVIKYYELRNDRVLVLVPKKLRENWTIYTYNDKRNILSSDRFNYDVLNHTDLSRQNGFSGEINLETINWGNYDLVVIDESHNFRNNNPRVGIETRYSKLMNYIIKAGVKTKVLMLSATPVNNRMNDIKNQVAFITEGDDNAFSEFGISNISDVMKKAQQEFNRWLKSSNKNSNSLLEALDARYFKLLDLITIARSRKHIEKYYNIEEIGEFPERLIPLTKKPNLDLKREFPDLKIINDEIRKLNLSAYSPLKYLFSDKQKEYHDKYDLNLKSGSVFKQSDREQSLIHLMRVNILKRLESSIHSFDLTLEKLLEKVDFIIDKIQNRSDYYDESLTISDIEIDDPLLEDMLIGNKIKVLLQDVDTIRWKQDLLEDKQRLENLLKESKSITIQRDEKFITLQEIINKKIKSPINPNNKKVLVFTAFSDTAIYLYKNLSDWLLTTHSLKSALITGGKELKTNMPNVRNEINEILINFSPISKKRDSIYPDATDEIDVIITTDCISEGQNLQDCDYLINYDIHWNPVRIIQRFGRIDRLGSQNKKIKLVNFWPNMELDEYINLESRVSGRMVLLDVSATGEENVIENDGSMNDLDYRKKQLEQLQSSVIDLEDLSAGISITDLTYNDFKMELMEYLKEFKDDLQGTPTSIGTVVKTDFEEIQEGVIFCIKQSNNDIKLDKQNALEPYYLIYINNDLEVLYSISQSKKVMDYYQKLCSGEDEFLTPLMDDFKKFTKNYKDMGFYQKLLEKSIEEIIGTNTQKGTSSLFGSGGTTPAKDFLLSVNDFELISYLVVKHA